MVVYVIVDEPNVADQAHSTYAQEVVRDIMQDIFPYMGIYPEESQEKKDGTEPTATPQSGDSTQTGVNATEQPVKGVAFATPEPGTE